jgi:hypothetical protein
LLVQSYVIGTQISTHVLRRARMPQFERNSREHAQLASLSHRAHDLAQKAHDETVDGATRSKASSDLRAVEDEIDEKASTLWRLTADDVLEIRRSLKELE